MATPRTFIDNLTMAECLELRRKLKRPHSDFTLCLDAYDNVFFRQVVEELPSVEFAKIVKGDSLVDDTGETSPFLLRLMFEIKDVVETLRIENEDEEPTASEVRRVLYERIDDKIDNAGDYMLMMAYVCFLLARHEDRKLTWEHYTASRNPEQIRLDLAERIEKWREALEAENEPEDEDEEVTQEEAGELLDAPLGSQPQPQQKKEQDKNTSSGSDSANTGESAGLTS